jgi:hypothetical protein
MNWLRAKAEQCFSEFTQPTTKNHQLGMKVTQLVMTAEKWQFKLDNGR